MESIYDIIVIGGGAAGIIAAIQAGRLGIQTLLVEKQGIAGGTLVTSGIPTPASFHAYDKQIIAGIGWEICCRTQEETGEHVPVPRTVVEREGGTVHFGLRPAVFAAIADEMLLEAGVDILFHAMPASVEADSSGWNLQLCTKTGFRDVRAGRIIDCTGDANVVKLAGFKLRKNPEIQAATLVVRASGYQAESLDYETIQKAFEEEVSDGCMRSSDPGWMSGRFDFFLKNYGGNRIHIPNLPAATSEEKTRVELEGRKAMLRILRFCRKQPGLENFTIDYCAPECGIRETVTIKGKKKISIKDYESGRLWEDAVSYSFYMLGIHRNNQIVSRNIKQGIYPTIPLGAMLPADSERIIVAGRCIAGDQEANSAYRIQASCMAMGQAAGAAAALALRLNTDFEAVPIEDLRTTLRQHRAIVPPDLTYKKVYEKD